MFSVMYKNQLIPEAQNLSFKIRDDNQKYYIDIMFDDMVLESKEYNSVSARTEKLNALKTAIGNVVDIDSILN